MHSSTLTPVVMLHAYPLHSGMWDALRARLAPRRVLAPDFPGFGEAVAREISLQDFAQTVVAEMDAAGIDRAIIAGLSMGGYVAFRIADGWQDRVAGMVLADTRAGPDSEEAARKRTEQAERARREGIGWIPDAMMPKVLGETTRDRNAALVAQVRSMMLEATPAGVANALLAMRDRPDSRQLLSRIDAPVLVLVGEEDEITGIEEARAIERGIPGAKLEVIPAAGHLSNLENPEAFGAAVEEFLDEIDKP